jgi:hypothetical protein
VLGTSVVALLALAIGAVAAVRHVRHERRLDRAEKRAVSVLVAVQEPLQSPDGLLLELAVDNESPVAVHVQAVRVDDGPWLPVTFGADLVPHQATSLPLPVATRCAPDTGRAVHEVTVRLTTHRGQSVTRRQPLSGGDLLDLHERQRCGTLTPGEALAASVVSARRRGGWVEVGFDLRNTSVLPLSLTALSPPRGVRLAPFPLPLRLPPAAAPGGTGPSVQLVLRLRVTDCRAFEEGLLSEESGEAFVRVALHGPHEDQSTPLVLAATTESGPGVASPDPKTRLMESCPAVFFG